MLTPPLPAHKIFFSTSNDISKKAVWSYGSLGAEFAERFPLIFGCQKYRLPSFTDMLLNTIP
jgi:hypothetical protein